MRLFGALFLLVPGTVAKGVHMWATSEADNFVENSGMVKKYKIENIEEAVLGNTKNSL